ncbi:glycoside hydrolase family 75 protein [Streptomyces orinoci]|uniref:Glycoside hydrolase family 75 protein n=1 Tax=Streptomyces orinoci TaxID=67339 RepID=A0ABV3JVY8_STRON|nr:glycoside hydrolase family 75 protein [Streptomyces orinoci]
MTWPRLAITAATALLSLTSLALPTHATTARHAAMAPDNGVPSAADLLAATATCRQVSHGAYHNAMTKAPVPVCGGANGAYFWTSSMTIDCDGQRTAQCSEATDKHFRNDTAVHRSDHQPFDAAVTPYVVLPWHSAIWNYTTAGIRPGDVVAVIYQGQVEYAVFGDTGKEEKIGEASYATATALGINNNPNTGGAREGVTYIVFPHTRPAVIEDHDQAVVNGRAAAADFAHHG